ncbi:hypothetical protein ACWFRM_27345 [Streptomyces sp. NPDC055144]
MTTVDVPSDEPMVLYRTRVRVSSRGPKAVAGLSSRGLVICTLIPPGTILVVLGLVLLGQGNGSAAPVGAANLFPQWTGLAGLVLIVNSFLSCSGMEMIAVHVSSLKNPAKESAYATLGRAMANAYGKPMDFLGQGGSIPLCNVLAQAYPRAEIVPVGVEEPQRPIHAANESVNPSEIEHMAQVDALFLRAYGTEERR